MAYQSALELDEMLAFVAVAQAHGFSAAARATSGRKATLSKRVQDLEARLGVSLLARTTRAVRLTDEGSAYLEHAQRALSAARDAEAAVLAAKQKPRGMLRVTTTVSFATPVIENVVAAYLVKCPEVAVHLDTSERHVDLVREGFDLAIRVGSLQDSTLLARRLGLAHGGFYASPRYLAKRGEPKRPHDLSEHDTIVLPKPDAAMHWPFQLGGKRQVLRVRPRLIVTDLEAAARAAAAGIGILRAPAQVVQPYLAAKQLVPILRAFTPPSMEVHAVFPPGGGLVPKTRVFLEMLRAWFGELTDSRRSGRRT